MGIYTVKFNKSYSSKHLNNLLVAVCIYKLSLTTLKGPSGELLHFHYYSIVSTFKPCVNFVPNHFKILSLCSVGLKCLYIKFLFLTEWLYKRNWLWWPFALLLYSDMFCERKSQG